MNETELYQSMLRGDTKALEQLMDLYGNAVYRLVATILGGIGTSCDVEECCSDTFVAMWEQKGQFDPSRGGLRTWVLILARYRALDYRRKLQRRSTTQTADISEREDLPADGLTPEEHFMQGETQEALTAALVRLPEAERRLLYLRYFLEEPVDTIAREMNITRGAADTRLWRARQMLRKLLSKDGKVVPFNG